MRRRAFRLGLAAFLFAGVLLGPGAGGAAAVSSVPTYTLVINKAGNGSGTVTSSPAGIDCGSDCLEDYNEGTEVTLTANRAPGSKFDGWTGACTGTDDCVVTMDTAKSVTATFSLSVNRVDLINHYPIPSICFSSCELKFKAGLDKANNVTITCSTGGICDVTDPGGLVAGSNCSQLSPTTASCGYVEWITADLEGGPGDSTDDTLVFTPQTPSAFGLIPSFIDGGGGSNALTGGAGEDQIKATGSLGTNTFNGGGGNDTLDAASSPGADVLNGGAGVDTATYASSAESVNVTIDGDANDGRAGEHDDVTADVETVVGSAFDDSLTGGEGDEVLRGGPGTDSLTGGNGSDTADYSDHSAAVVVDIDGEEDDGAAGEKDRVETDIENITGGSAGDTLTGNDGANILKGGPGADALRGGPGSDTADYSDHTGALIVDLDGAADDGESGEGDNAGADMENIRGGSGNDTLIGNDEDNSFDGGPGGDTFSGLLGSDTADYSGRTVSVTVDIDDIADDGQSGENDNVLTNVENILGGSNWDTLRGSGQANELNGGGGFDRLFGEAGDDILRMDQGGATFDGGPGSDTFDGGPFFDTVDYSARAARVVADIDGVADDGEVGENDNIMLDVEKILGGSGDDRLTANQTIVPAGGGVFDNWLEGGAGGDELIGGPGKDWLQGDGGTDVLTGGAGDDFVLAGAGSGHSLNGGPGNDSLNGGEGGDTLQGGPGDDDIGQGPGSDVLSGGDGFDAVVYAREGNVTVDLEGDADDGEAGENDLVGSDFEAIYGGNGNDRLTGNDAANTLQGGWGNDVLDGRDGADQLYGGPDVDTVDYSSRTADVTADPHDTYDDGEDGEGDHIGVDIENITGGAGNDTLTGDSGEYGTDGENTLTGNGGNDTLSGAGADDVLVGGPGADTLDGGGGLDDFAAGDGDDQIDSRDTIGAEPISCGADLDDVVADPTDTVAGDCENVDIGIWTLTLTKAGTGSGTVSSDPDGIDCGPSCAGDTGDYDTGTTVDLGAVADDESLFGGWSNDCAGMDECTVEMTEARAVTATFTARAAGDPDEVAADVGADGEVTTDGADDGASPTDPIETSVTTPVAGAVSITETPGAPVETSGYTFLGYQVSITAPTATPADPLVIVFLVDSSLLPAGGPGAVILHRSGVPIAPCTGADATPDPCVQPPVTLVGGDGQFTVRTSLASLWAFGVAKPQPPQPPAPPGPAADVTSPALQLVASARQKLLKALKQGVLASITCSESCAVVAELRLSRKVAKRLKLPMVVGKLQVTLAQAVARAVKVKLIAKAKRKFAQLNSVALVLKITATDPAGNASAASKGISLRR